MYLTFVPKIGEIYRSTDDVTLYECVFYNQTNTFIFNKNTIRITKNDAILVLFKNQKIVHGPEHSDYPSYMKDNMTILLFNNKLYYTFAMKNFKKIKTL